MSGCHSGHSALPFAHCRPATSSRNRTTILGRGTIVQGHIAAAQTCKALLSICAERCCCQTSAEAYLHVVVDPFSRPTRAPQPLITGEDDVAHLQEGVPVRYCSFKGYGKARGPMWCSTQILKQCSERACCTRSLITCPAASSPCGGEHMSSHLHSPTAMMGMLLYSPNQLTCPHSKLVQSEQCSRHLVLQPGSCPHYHGLFCNSWIVTQICSQRQEPVMTVGTCCCSLAAARAAILACFSAASAWRWASSLRRSSSGSTSTMICRSHAGSVGQQVMSTLLSRRGAH